MTWRRKKIIGFLSLFLIAVFAGVLVFIQTGPVSALTDEEIRAEITRLQSELDNLLTQLAVLSPGSSLGQISRNLQLGDRGADVLYLQQFLNKDSRTRVAFSGPGSLGQETDYFGPLTRGAVSKFQEIYASEVLTPLGLSAPTGFVGSATRSKISELSLSFSGSSSSSSEPETTSTEGPETIGGSVSVDQIVQSSSLAEEVTPFIQDIKKSLASIANSSEIDRDAFTVIQEQVKNLDSLLVSGLTLGFPSSYEGRAGSTLTLHGSGFSSTGNTIHFGSNQISNISSSDGRSLSFTVPNVSLGKYDIEVSSSGFTTNSDTFFVVTNGDLNNPSRPVIHSVSPESVGYGQSVTINGDNFSTTGNEIRTSYGIIRDISSPDGKTMTFQVRPFPEVFDLFPNENAQMPKNWEISIYVISSGGVSSQRGVLMFNP